MPLTPGQYVLRKLPHITALFWAIKILATTLGETAGDYFSQTLGLGTLRAAVLLLAIFLVAVTIQLRASRFHPALFWTMVVLTSTAGTYYFGLRPWGCSTPSSRPRGHRCNRADASAFYERLAPPTFSDAACTTTKCSPGFRSPETP